MWPAAVSARLGKPAYGKANDVDQCDEHGFGEVIILGQGHTDDPSHT